jgi:3-dehydroquinate synthase
MRAAADLAVRGNLLEQKDADRLAQLISAFGMPVTIPTGMDRQRIKKYLKTDKKTVGGKVFFVLPTRIGQVAVTDQVTEEDIDAVLN